MFGLTVLLIIIFGQFCSTSLINKVGNGCDPPPIPYYLPDSNGGSYCRMHSRYSQLDFVFLIDASNGTLNVTLEAAQKILFNSLKLHDALFSNSPLTNDAAFVFVADKAYESVKFGTLNTTEDVAEQFKTMIFWRNKINNYSLNISAGLQHIHEQVFDYKNGRGKLLTVIANKNNPLVSNDPYYATKMKNNGVNIFSIAYTDDLFDFDITNTFYGDISTLGWHHPLLNDNEISYTSSSLFVNFLNFARQSNCICPQNTTQFTANLASNNPFLGPIVKEYYADCLFKDEDNENGTLETSTMICRENIDYNSRPVAVNTSAKYEFLQEYLSGNVNAYWTGKNDSNWITYSGTSLSVNYLPPSIYDQSIQNFCKTLFTPGTAAAIVPFNDTFILCNSTATSLLQSICEYKVFDALDNPGLCNSPFINADTRPSQTGSSCPNNLIYFNIDMVVIVDVSKYVTLSELQEASKTLINSFKQLNLKSTRLALITVSTFPTVIANFGQIDNVEKMEKIFNLKKYSTSFGQRNSDAAFKLAQTMFLLNKSHKSQSILFISSGITNSSDPYKFSQVLKNQFEVKIVTISTTASEKIDRLASIGLNTTLKNEKLEANFPTLLSYVNCRCQKGTQFIAANDGSNEIVYYADCLIAHSTPETPEAASKKCKNNGGNLVALTSAAKSKFIQQSIIFNQLQKSPVFTVGLKRNSANINSHIWSYRYEADFPFGPFPPRFPNSNFDNLNDNCTFVTIVQGNTFIAPITCSNVKLPFICEFAAIDGENQK